MDRADKIRVWKAFVKKKRSWWWNPHSPALDILLMREPFNLPPSVFWSPLAFFATTSTAFGLFWGIGMHFLLGNANLHFEWIYYSAAGISFGLLFTLFRYFVRKKYELTSWQAFLAKYEKRD
jgi:hypothetical protein